MITIKQKGSFKNTTAFLGFLYRKDFLKKLDSLAQRGVEELKRVTPVDTGNTANAWDYKIYKGFGKVKIIWTNSNVTKDGTPIVILLQYGHATKDGYYIQGRDFIPPTMQTTFDRIANEIWDEVKNA